MRARGHDWPTFETAGKMYQHFGFEGAKESARWVARQGQAMGKGAGDE